MEKKLSIKIDIDTKTGKVVALNGSFDELQKTINNVSTTTDRFLKRLTDMAHIGASLYVVDKAIETIKETMKATIVEGIKLNSTIESATAGIAALINANTTGADNFKRFNIAMKLSTDTIKQLKKASIDTVATFPELTEIFQQAIGGALGANKAFGKNIDEIIQNTIKLSQRMSNIAGAIGMPMEQVNEEIRSIIEGTITADSRIGKMLHLTNAEINKAKESIGGLAKYLNEKLAPFDVLANVDTLNKSFARLKDTIDNVRIEATKPIFDNLKTETKELTKWIKENKITIVNSIKTTYFFMKKFAILINALFIQPIRVSFNLAEIAILKFLSFFAEKLVYLENMLNSMADKFNSLTKYAHIDFHIEKSHGFRDSANWFNNKINQAKQDMLSASSYLYKLPNDLENVDKEFTKAMQNSSTATKKLNENLKQTTTNTIQLKQAMGNLDKQNNFLKSLQNQLNSFLSQDKQLEVWYQNQKKVIDKLFKDSANKKEALAKLDELYSKKHEQLLAKQAEQIADKQKSLMQSLQSEYNSFLPKREQIGIWYNEMRAKIKELYKNNSEEMKKAFGLLDEVTINKLREVNSENNKNNDKQYNPQNQITNMTANVMKNFGVILTDETKKVIDKVASRLGEIGEIATKSLKFLFEKQYDVIKAKYEDTIDTLTQTTYTDKLKSNAYSAFGYGGYSKVANYNADVAHIKMLQEQNAMNYELSKKAKEYKETTQTILEAGSLALGAAAAIWFDGGAVIDGISNAIKSQDWAEQMTGFQNFQQAYIQGVEEYKQSLRDLANELISLAGDIYKSIDDYRNIYDKITDTNTYEMQKYAESLQYIEQYTNLTANSLANFTQEILKADKSFIEGAVDSASSVDSLLNNDLFKKYGLAIDSLNEKFKDSLSVVADLIDKQREANDAIKDYIAELNTKIHGNNNYVLESTQADYVQALSAYNKGEIDVNELLDKAKSFESASGNNIDLLQQLASSLKGITQKSTEDYLKGILEQVSTFNTIGLPDENIDDLTAPEEDTLEAIKDTNNFLEKLLNGFIDGIFLKGVDDSLGSIIGILGDILNAITNGITDLFGGIVNGVSSIVGGISDAVGGIVGGFGDALGGLTGDVVNGASGLFGGTLGLVTGGVGGLLGSVGGVVGDVLGGFGFAEGGYTGAGNYLDQTGERVAGIVHDNEWVAPKWMLQQNPDLFRNLEKARINKNFDQFGTSTITAINSQNSTINIIEIQQTNSILQEQLSIHKKMYRLMQKFDDEGIKCNS